MTHRRNQNVGRDGTLDRLNDALSALETRIAGASRPPETRSVRDDIGDIASIREREAALRARNVQVQPAQAAAQSTQPSKKPSAEFDMLRDEIRAMGSASVDAGAGVRELRQDIDGLKAAVTQLARQDALNDLSDRWGVVEREIARMPETLASREDVADMVARLDVLSQSIGAMPQDFETRALEERIQTLAAAMEAFGAQQAGLEKNLFDGMHDRFSAIDRAIEGVALQSSGADTDALDRIEARITSFTRQIEDMQSAPSHDYTPHFNDMIGRLETLQATGGSDPAVHEALTLIAERVADLQMAPSHGEAITDREIEALSGRLDQIVDLLHASQANQGMPLAEPAINEIESRLDSLTEQLSLSAENTGRSVDQAVAALENRIGDLARTLDERQDPLQSVGPLESVEERLDDIARFLTQNAESPAGTPANAAFDTQALEMQIAELSARLAETGTNMATAPAFESEGAAGVDVMHAARSAAEEVLAQAKMNGFSAPDVERLSDDLKSLEALARETDGRNERTFEAIHDTLLKIVDHLADIEHKEANNGVSNPAGLTQQPLAQSDLETADDGFIGYQEPLEPVTAAPAIPSQGGLDAAPPTARMPVDDAPSMDTSVPEPMSQGSVTQELTPAQAAASAAIAAMSQSGGDAVRDEPAPAGKKSIFQAVTSRLRGGDKEEATSSIAHIESGSDTPLEPDTAQAEVAEIIARVRREREGGQTPTTAAPAVEVPAQARVETSSSKSDFIAAARRAAQAAASDAQAAETRTSSKTDGLKSTVSSLISQRRRPILIGAAAILVAMLALPLVRGLLGGGQEVATAPTEPPTIEQTVQAVDQPEAEEPAEVAVAEPAEIVDQPRIVPIDTDGDIDVAAALPSDLANDLSVGEPTQLVDPLPVAAIPTDAGTPAMQDAAKSGETTAMFLVGDYFAAKAQTDGPASAAQNNRDALAWYTKSAEAGYAPAQQRLGSLYEKGIGAEKDLSIAKSWYQLAADQGNSAAMHNLGVLLANGVQGEPDLVQAVRWFEQAALYGVPDSQYNLGVMAVRGDGMEPSLKESYKWFALAAQSGDTDAAAKRDTVAERMDPATLKLAKDEVALWRPRQLDQAANTVSVPDAWQTDQMRTASAPADDPIDMKKAVGNIQAILNNNGYDAGSVDGVMGEKTRQAIKAFQSDNGMAATGEVNEELVRKLLELTA